MSASVEQWPPIETTDENLPEQFSGLLTWVLTELTGDEPYDEDLEDQFSLRREVDTTVCKDQPPEIAPEPEEASKHEASEHEAKNLELKNPALEETDTTAATAKHVNKLGETSSKTSQTLSIQSSQDSGPIPDEAGSIDRAREQVLELAAKRTISEEAIQDADPVSAAVHDSPGSWSVSALDQSPATPHDNVNVYKQEAVSSTREISPSVKQQLPPCKPKTSSVATWVMNTDDAPVATVLATRTTSSSAQYGEIDPETGALLPAIDHPDTHPPCDVADVQSEPGWRRGNMTSDMQISRELRARARLALCVKNRLVGQPETTIDAVEEEPTPFPKADCVVRPATKDDVAEIAQMLNSDHHFRAAESHSIPKWDIRAILNKCHAGNRPFVVATTADDELLDRSNWPAGADKAFRAYVKYRTTESEQPKSSLVGFAFAAPRLGANFDTCNVGTDHSCYVTMFVHPDHRLKGYGSALLDRILLSVSPYHRSLIDFEWKCEDPSEVYEHPASNNAQQYSRVFVEYLDAHAETERLQSRKPLLEKFGFKSVGNLTCMRSERHDGKQVWLDLFIWELEAQALENVR